MCGYDGWSPTGLWGFLCFSCSSCSDGIVLTYRGHGFWHQLPSAAEPSSQCLFRLLRFSAPESVCFLWFLCLHLYSLSSCFLLFCKHYFIWFSNVFIVVDSNVFSSTSESFQRLSVAFIFTCIWANFLGSWYVLFCWKQDILSKITLPFWKYHLFRFSCCCLLTYCRNSGFWSFSLSDGACCWSCLVSCLNQFCSLFFLQC